MTWQPSASIESLKQRAEFYEYIREFFKLRQVMEVETPVLSRAAVSDPYLLPVSGDCMGSPVFLHTSPEYPMKRMLAAGSGDIYQICKVFRDQESGSRHNPEFSMLEYYRLGFSLKTLMDEVAQLVGDFLQLQRRVDLAYDEAMMRYAKVNPFQASDAELLSAAHACMQNDIPLDRDGCLDILMTHLVEPSLPQDCLVFIGSYPPSQAALANIQLDEQGNEVAQRFELYVNGLELANGYDELSDVQEQQRRFQQDAEKQTKSGATTRPVDQYFLDALASGLPACSGVAIGLDRILMLKAKASVIDEVISFPFQHS